MGKSLGNSGFGCTERRISNAGPSGAGGSVSQPTTFYDTKSSGTDGGTFTSGGWVTRELNTVQSDPNGVATISGNQINLVAGSYTFLISCPAYSVGQHQARLQNITASTTVANGTVETTSGMSVQTRSTINCSVSVAVPTIMEVQHQCSITKANDGLGLAGGLTEEIYTVVQVWAT